jgi:hypothetical protein
MQSCAGLPAGARQFPQLSPAGKGRLIGLVDPLHLLDGEKDVERQPFDRDSFLI